MKTCISDPVLEKVVIVGPDILSQGGMGSVLYAYSQFLSPFNYLTTNSRYGTFAGFFNFGISLLKLPILRIRGKKILHIHYAGLRSWPRKKLMLNFGKLLGYKTIMHCHCNLPAMTKLKGLTNVTRTLQKADINLTLATEYDKFAKKELKLPLTGIINNTICGLSEIEAKRGETITFLFMGVMTEAKGIYDLIEAAGLLRKRGKNFRLIMAGKGKDEAAVKDLVQKHTLSDYVEFPGWIKGDEKLRTIAKSHVFVLPSHNEGMPMSIIETKYYGLPTIATKIGATVDIITDGEEGYLVNIGDVEGIAKAMENYIDNTELIKSHGRKSRESAKMFMPDFVGQNLIKLYKSISD